MKKNDILLIGGIIIIAAALFFIFNINKGGGTEAIIYQYGVEYDRKPIDYSGEVIVEGRSGEKNVIEFKDGKVHMKDANCPDGLCISQGEAYQNRDMIVCLPNEVYIEIVADGEESFFDSTAQ